MLGELFVGKPKVNVRLQIALDVKRRTMFFANFAAQTALDVQGVFFYWSALKMTKCQITCKSILKSPGT